MQTGQSDPYEGLETQEEREAMYQKLREQYEKDLKLYNESVDKYSKACSGAWNAMDKKCSQEDSFFEKAVFTVAAGSFGVSFVFINQIVPLSSAVHKTILAAAWLLFGICLICS